MAYTVREYPSSTEVLFPLASEHTYRSLGWILLQDTRVKSLQLPKEMFLFFKLKNNYRRSSIKSPGAYLFQARFKGWRDRK